jgi:hypothetical protein
MHLAVADRFYKDVINIKQAYNFKCNVYMLLPAKLVKHKVMIIISQKMIIIIVTAVETSNLTLSNITSKVYEFCLSCQTQQYSRQLAHISLYITEFIGHTMLQYASTQGAIIR